ncbi:MAG TPA: SRPBCC family protein [Rhizomicrobium sp.]|jgi:uncharacterized protein YndB with AHSA1/START domain
MNTQTIKIAPVKKILIVRTSQAKAFEVFTAGLDRWWPKSHGIGGTPLKLSVIEPFKGGRWYSVHEDGSEVTVGHLLAWEPPSRIVFSWEISAEWKPDASVASEVEVRFIAEGPHSTRVELEHRNFEALGQEGGEKMRKGVDGGWPGILEMFGTEAAR